MSEPKCSQCGIVESEFKTPPNDQNDFYWADDNLCSRCFGFEELIKSELGSPQNSDYKAR